MTKMASRKSKAGRVAILAGRAPAKRRPEDTPSRAGASPRGRSPRGSAKGTAANLVARIRPRDWDGDDEALRALAADVRKFAETGDPGSARMIVAEFEQAMGVVRLSLPEQGESSGNRENALASLKLACSTAPQQALLQRLLRFLYGQIARSRDDEFDLDVADVAAVLLGHLLAENRGLRATAKRRSNTMHLARLLKVVAMHVELPPEKLVKVADQAARALGKTDDVQSAFFRNKVLLKLERRFTEALQKAEPPQATALELARLFYEEHDSAWEHDAVVALAKKLFAPLRDGARSTERDVERMLGSCARHAGFQERLFNFKSTDKGRKARGTRK